jgi:hypothetical protein
MSSGGRHGTVLVAIFKKFTIEEAFDALQL